VQKAIEKLVGLVRKHIPLAYTLGSNQYALLEAKKKYASMMAEGQANADLKLIDSGEARFDFSNGQLIALSLPSNSETVKVPPSLPEPHKLIDAVVLEDTVRRAENLAAVIQDAAEQAEAVDDGSVSDLDVDADWFFRWREHSERVSDEIVRKLWARLLVGEIQSPKSVSLRTMSMLSNISVEEARLIEKLWPLIIEDDYLFAEKEVLDQFGLSFDDTLQLIEIGVIADALFRTVQIKKTDGKGFIEARPYWLMLEAPEGTEFQFAVSRLTRLGLELFRLSGSRDAPLDYLRKLANSLAGGQRKVSLVQAKVEGGRIHYSKPVETFPSADGPIATGQ